jgi:hypothetical protein
MLLLNYFSIFFQYCIINNIWSVHSFLRRSCLLFLILKWSVSVVFQFIAVFDINQFEIFFQAVRTLNSEVLVFLWLLSHVSNAKPANIVLAARRDEDLIEIPETDGTTILKDFSLSEVCWIVILCENIFLTHICFNSYFVPLSDVTIIYYFWSHIIILLPHIRDLIDLTCI